MGLRPYGHRTNRNGFSVAVVSLGVIVKKVIGCFRGLRLAIPSRMRRRHIARKTIGLLGASFAARARRASDAPVPNVGRHLESGAGVEDNNAASGRQGVRKIPCQPREIVGSEVIGNFRDNDEIEGSLRHFRRQASSKKIQALDMAVTPLRFC
jgi:hypothetical protein